MSSQTWALQENKRRGCRDQHKVGLAAENRTWGEKERPKALVSGLSYSVCHPQKAGQEEEMIPWKSRGSRVNIPVVILSKISYPALGF